MVEEKYILGDLSQDLYNKFIEKYRSEKAIIEENLQKCDVDLSNLEKQVDSYLEFCENLPFMWQEASYKLKTEIQNMVFPEGILYDREIDDYRAPKINSVILAMSQISMGLEGVEKRKTVCINGFSNVVDSTGLFSNHFLQDLEILANLKDYLLEDNYITKAH